MTARRPRRLGSRWTAVASIAAALFLASIAPVPGGGSGSFPITLPFHFVGYAALAIALLSATEPVDSTHAFAGSTGYGAFVEVLQYPLPYRAFDYGDVAVNALGAAFAIIGWWLYCRTTA